MLFVKPLRVRPDGAQAGGAVYRKVVIRNLVCTVLVCVSYIITTVVTVSALLRETSEEDNPVRCIGCRASFKERPSFYNDAISDSGGSRVNSCLQLECQILAGWLLVHYTTYIALPTFS